MKLTAEDAREYFTHPSQRLHGLDPAHLTDVFTYYADGPICGVFHPMPWPGIWMVHYGVKPEGWGRLIEPAKRALAEFAADVKPFRVVGWTPVSNRLACAFTRRVGFIEDGRMPSPDGELLMTGWCPCQ